MTQLVDHAGRMVNHLQTFYQPGEQHLAVKVYQALGAGFPTPPSARRIRDS